MEKIIFHVDVNSAFLSWEAVYRLKHLHAKLDLRTIPSAVGGSQELRHGIVMAKSIPCKPYKIQTGESLMEARQKCPNLVVVPPNYNLYKSSSNALMEIMRSYTPDVEQYSIDEAFMDMTGTKSLWGEPVTAANRLREEIHNNLGFTVNIGVSNNKLLAKMASDFMKPNMVHTLFPDEIKEKMWKLPIGDLFYVGRATKRRLENIGITTIGQLANSDVEMIKSHLKNIHGQTVWNYANGIDFSEIKTIHEDNRGYGNSTTIPYDVDSLESASMVLLSLAETVGMRLRKDNAKISVIAVGIKYNDFSYVSQQVTLKEATNITQEIHANAVKVFAKRWDYCTPIRHLGIHTSKAVLNKEYRQLSLFDVASAQTNNGNLLGYEKLERIDSMVDSIRQTYGIDSIKRARFVESKISHATGGISRDKDTVDYERVEVI